jgi:hypothetical protein
VWGVDWPASIGLLQAFHSQYPTQANATEKLYAAMVEYGRALRDAGATSAAADEFEQALRLAPQRFEARDELTALTPIPTAVPVQAPIAAPVAPQPTPVPPPVRVPAPTATPPPPPPTVDTSPGCDVTDPDIACPLANGSRIENLIQAPAGRHYYWFGIPTSGMLLHIEVNGEACPCSLRIFSDQTPIAAGLAVLERTMPIPGAYVLEVAPDQNGTNDAAYLLEFALQPPPTPTAAPVVEAATETPAPTSTPVPVPVPPVVGRTASDAVDRVRAVGLEARTQTADRYSPGGVGSIAVQDPPAGSLLPPGASVTLLVASGNVVVPDVIGMFEQDAWNALHGAGLDVDTRHARRSNVDAGRTADVNPGGGSVLPAGSTVVLTISQGN